MINGGLNPGIVQLIVGKTEKEATGYLDTFKRKWRVYSRNGAALELPPDRDDSRYSLIIDQGIVKRVIAG